MDHCCIQLRICRFCYNHNAESAIVSRQTVKLSIALSLSDDGMTEERVTSTVCQVYVLVRVSVRVYVPRLQVWSMQLKFR